MPQIIPIRDLKNTTEISNLCRETQEPVFITKNGYGDMVIMSIDTYDRNMFMQDVYSKLSKAEGEISNGKTKDARESLKGLRAKYGI